MNPSTHLPDPPKQQGMRRRLVDTLRKEGIAHEGVLAAIGRVKRHLFVEATLQDMAYNNIALPIASGQTISQPYTVARQTELLQLPTRHPRVLEVGTGSGYQAAVLCEMGVTVFSIERHDTLHKQSKQLLRDLGYRVWLRHGDGTQGWEEYAPYDGILVTAGAPVVPELLCRQLAVGGRLVIPVGERDTQVMNVITRTGPETWVRDTKEAFKFVPLVGKHGWQTEE